MNSIDKRGEAADIIATNKAPISTLHSCYTRSSYSSASLLHACPRKFQLKSLGMPRQIDAVTGLTFAFGHAVGDGIASLLLGMPIDEVIFKTFINWDVEFLITDAKRKKSLPHAIFALKLFDQKLKDGYLEEYEVATYHGKPAAELSFKISIKGKYATHYHRGFIDLILRNTRTNEFIVVENKTNSGNWVNHFLYKNSAQALGYSVILDKIEGDASAYQVLYNIFMTKLLRYEDFLFSKNLSMRARWLRDIYYDVETVENYFEKEGNYGIWPMRGESCVNFGRVCEYMDVCQLRTENLVPVTPDAAMVEDEEREYQFNFTLAELFIDDLVLHST